MKNKRGIFCITTGLLLIAAALAITGYNTWEDKQAKNASDKVMDRLKVMVAEKTETPAEPEIPEQQESLPVEIVIEEEIPDYILNPNMDMPVKMVDGREYIGVLEIPVYDLVLPVISEWSYSALKVSPCRYTGSVYKNNLVIAGHNYKTHFSKVKNIAEGERIRFTDMDGNLFEYEVVVREVLTPDAVEDLISGDWDLTLFTCTYDGQNRVAVRCEYVENGA